MNININNDFVIKFRKYLEISQKDFAKELEVNIRTIQAIEQNQRKVPKSVINAILSKYSQFIKEGTLENIKNIPDKQVYLSRQAKAIINLRDYYGLSQEALSKRTGISRQTINEIENNKKKVTLKIQRTIENIYGALIHYYDDCFININERFKYARCEILNYNESQGAKKLKISVQKLRDIEGGKKMPTKEIIELLEKEYLINSKWLLTGEGNTTKIEDAEDAERMASLQPQNNIVTIPFYNAKAAAGKGNSCPEYEECSFLYFDRRWIKNFLAAKPENLSIIQAQGDSMDSGWEQPTDIKDGDLLMVDTSQTTGNNKVFVILVNNTDLRVKRLFKMGENLHIVSNNPKYKEEVYSPNESENEIKIIGRVIWNGKENV